MCTKIHFVHVPIDHGCEGNARAEDLKFEQYLDVESSINGFVVDLDDFTVEYECYPRIGLVNSYRWTVFSSDHVSRLLCFSLTFLVSYTSCQRQDKVNTLIPTFYGANVLTRDVHGSFLVAKSNREGIVQHVCREDLQLIRDLVVE
jgi:hypothetical protein